MITTSDINFDSRIINEAKTLSKRYQITIISRKFSSKPIYLNKNIIFKKIAYKKYSINFLTLINYFWKISRAVFKESPDYFHSHDLDGLLLGFMPAIFKRKILIYDSHELWSKLPSHVNLKGIKWLLHPLEKIAMLKVKSGITVNDSIANVLHKKYHKQFLTLRNLPSIKLKLQGKSIFKKVLKDQKNLLFLGRPAKWRGAEQIIEAMKLLPQYYCLYFLGCSKLDKGLNQKILKYNLKKQVILLEALEPRSLINKIRGADIGIALTQNVSLSYYLSLPNKIFQYLAAEIPILGSNFPEFKNVIIKNRIGEVADPANIEEIIRKIISMNKKENQKKYHRNLKELGLKKYNWETEAQKLVSFYEKLDQSNSKFL